MLNPCFIIVPLVISSRYNQNKIIIIKCTHIKSDTSKFYYLSFCCIGMNHSDSSTCLHLQWDYDGFSPNLIGFIFFSACVTLLSSILLFPYLMNLANTILHKSLLIHSYITDNRNNYNNTKMIQFVHLSPPSTDVACRTAKFY